MTDKEQQFNQWFDQYANGVKVFEEADMKQAYLQGRAELEQENAELKGLKDVATLIRANNDTVVTLMQLNNKLVSKSQQLTKAKKLLERLLITSCNSDVLNLLPNCSEVLKVRVEAEKFLNSDKPREEKEERKYYCKTCRDLMCPYSGTERYEINCSGVEED